MPHVVFSNKRIRLEFENHLDLKQRFVVFRLAKYEIFKRKKVFKNKI